MIPKDRADQLLNGEDAHWTNQSMSFNYLSDCNELWIGQKRQENEDSDPVVEVICAGEVKTIVKKKRLGTDTLVIKLMNGDELVTEVC